MARYSSDPNSINACAMEAERIASRYVDPEVGVDTCIICGIEDDLINGICNECLATIFQNHSAEITEWNAEEVGYDPDYDLSTEGARQTCLKDDPWYFTDWLKQEHPEWISEVM